MVHTEKQEAVKPPSLMITQTEAAKLLGVCRGTLFRWEIDGLLPIPSMRLGRRVVRYRRSDIESMCAQGVKA